MTRVGASGVDVAVVVPVAGSAPHLEEQLAALAAQRTERRWELLVVDNGCDASCRARLDVLLPTFAAARVVDARVVDARDVPGSAATRSRGAAAAHADLLLFCDADDVVDPGWVEAMADALRTADVVGGRLRYDRINPPDVVAGLPARWQQDGLASLWGEVPYVLSCSLGVRREAFEAVGGFDPSLPIGGGEDVDLAWRLHAAGATVRFAPDACVDYRLRADLRARLRQQRAYGRGNALLRRRHRGAVPPLRPAEVAGTLARVVTGSRTLVLGRRRREIWLCWVAYVASEYATLLRRRA